MPDGRIRFSRVSEVMPNEITPLLVLVEKEDDYSILFQRIFTKIASHWRLVVLTDLKAAMRHSMCEEFPDLLVTNIETDKLDARDMAEWLQFIKSPKSVSFLIFDHAPSTSQKAELARLGVTEYLNKRSPVETYRAVLQRLTLAIDTKSQSVSLVEETHAATPGFSRRF